MCNNAPRLERTCTNHLRYADKVNPLQYIFKEKNRLKIL